ncbi:MAG: DUF3999 family protein, partial [Schlesneria sp.]
MSRSIGLAMALCYITWVTTPIFAEEGPQFRWMREVELPEIAATTLVSVPLDSHFFMSTRDGWPDVRLNNNHDQPVAFFIQAAFDMKARTVRQIWPLQNLAAKVDTAVGLLVELVLRDDDPLPSGIRIITPLRDFEHQVRVESSSDGTSWTSAGPATLIFDYSRYVDARNEFVPLKAGNDRRFRLIIEDVTAEQESLLLELHRRLRGTNEIDRTENTTIIRRPFRIDRVEFYRDDETAENSHEQRTKYPTSNFVVTEREKEHQTLLTFDTKREPVSEIKVITESENFSRSATVEAEVEEMNGKLTWKAISSGTLTRLSIGSIQKQELTLSIRESHASRYRVVIDNRDSPALAITGVELSGPLYELMFLASSDQKLTLQYGSPEAKAGHYDTAALQAALSQGSGRSMAKLASPTENQNVPVDQGRRWKPWNDTRVLAGGIFALTLLLGWGLYTAGKQIELPAEK